MDPGLLPEVQTIQYKILQKQNEIENLKSAVGTIKRGPKPGAKKPAKQKLTDEEKYQARLLSQKKYYWTHRDEILKRAEARRLAKRNVN